METLLYLISNFRNAIDKAKSDGRFSKYSYFRDFPIGCCGTTSDILGTYLLEKGIHTRYVCGIYRGSGFENTQSHAWLILDDSTIIDITGDQFKYNELFYNNNEKVYVGKKNKFYKLFEEDFPPHEIYCLNHDEKMLLNIIKEYLKLGE